jgi:hypothetical protein
MILNGELKGMSKAHFRVLSQHLFGSTEENDISISIPSTLAKVQTGIYPIYKVMLLAASANMPIIFLCFLLNDQ